MEEKLKTLLQDEELARKLFSLESDTEVQSFLAENGVEFSLEKIAAMKTAIKARLENEDDELSEDMLEDVAGGSFEDDFVEFFHKANAFMQRW